MSNLRWVIRSVVIRGMLATVVAASALGCKGRSSDATQAEVTARLAKLREEESDVLARRDQIVAERQKVTADRVALAEKRREIAAAGGDTSAVDAEERRLAERESRLTEQEREIDRRLEGVLSGYQEVTLGAGASEGIVKREVSVAAREKEFARREQQIAAREASLAERERLLAVRERETCTTTVVQAALPAGANYTRRDVEPILRSVRRKMTQKGLLTGDLPDSARTLEKEATSAMGAGDFGKAKLAADQLLGIVNGIRIDRAFIIAKINRLNAYVKARPLAEKVRREVDGLFQQATGAYGDGKFADANGRLNRIFALAESP